MQWFGLILSFLIGKLNAHDAKPSRFSPEAIFDDVAFKSRKVVALTLGGVIAVLLLCGGLMMSIIDAAAQFDRNGVIYFSATFNTGLVLALIAAASFGLVFARAWPGVREHRGSYRETKRGFFAGSSAKPASSLETAISALILDFIKEREARRYARASESEFEHRRGKAFEQETPPVYHS